MGNRMVGRYDPGASALGETEAEIVMQWANELRNTFIKQGHFVVRTRVDQKDPAAISKRAKIAKENRCDIMLSLHCNAATGTATGTETFYRGEVNRKLAERINGAVCAVLETKNRGAKTESSSQHRTLAVMEFQPCFLIEIGFIDNKNDLQKMLHPDLRKTACEAIVKVIIGK